MHSFGCERDNAHTHIVGIASFDWTVLVNTLILSFYIYIHMFIYMTLVSTYRIVYFGLADRRHRFAIDQSESAIESA